MKVYGDNPRDVTIAPARKLTARGEGCVHRLHTDATDEQVYVFLQWECLGAEHVLSLEWEEIEAIPDIPGQEGGTT